MEELKQVLLSADNMKLGLQQGRSYSCNTGASASPGAGIWWQQWDRGRIETTGGFECCAPRPRSVMLSLRSAP